jgi:pentatricopeptide repeat protein
MEMRGLLTDPDVFKSLMEACGRCGDTKRALELIEMMKRDGLVADQEVLSCFMAAFAHDGGEGFENASIKDDFIRGRRHSDAYSAFLKKKLESMTSDSTAGTLQTGTMSSSEEESSAGEVLSDSGPEVSTTKQSATALLEWLTPHKKARTKKRQRKRRKRKSTIVTKGVVSDRLMKQIVLGESLLDFLYPDLIIDTRGDACPQCSNLMKESDIVSGWQPCEFQDFTTRCPNCSHRFVPRFSVMCTSPTFEGSQGPGTTFYCEFLSPWVLRRELDHVISGEGGIGVMLDPEWRSGTDIRATLWWNLITVFKRFNLPFSFLLQGSFQNRLISPVPQD